MMSTVLEPDRGDVTIGSADWLDADEVSDLMRNNLKLWYGRWLVHESLYDIYKSKR